MRCLENTSEYEVDNYIDIMINGSIITMVLCITYILSLIIKDALQYLIHPYETLSISKTVTISSIKPHIHHVTSIIDNKWMDDWCFRPRFCTVRVYWAGDNLCS